MRRFALAAVLCLIWLAAAVPAQAVPSTVLAGADAFATASRVSRSAFPTQAAAVVVVSASSWSDQLLATPLAGVARGPLLLAGPAGLPASAKAEIARLRPARVYVLGGSAFRGLVTTQARAVMPTSTVTGLGGSGSPQRSALVASAIAAARGGRAPERVLVVSQNSPGGTLAASAPAAARGWPIVFANPSRPAETVSAIQALGASRVAIVGSTSAVPRSVRDALVTAFGSGAVVRLTGADRVGVAHAVTRYAASVAGLGYSSPVIVSAASPAEAYLAGPLAARRTSVVVVVPTDPLPEPIGLTLFANRAAVRSLVFVGGSSGLPARVRTGVAHAVRARPFSRVAAMRHVRALVRLGPRRAGGSGERRAADYVAAQLRSYGYSVRIQKIALPGGRTSKNVIAEKPGTAPGVIVIGGHMDSKPPSPGGNDNASGVAVTLELARCLAQAEIAPTVRFIGFCAEEISGPTARDHHFGSRGYVASLGTAGRRPIEAMVSVDMVGYGSVFNVRNLRQAPMGAVWSLQTWGRASGQRLAYLKDPSRDGWSDHEAFEFAGIPAAWLEWRDDPDYHTTRDNYSHVSGLRVEQTGRLMRGWLLDLTPRKVAALKP